MMSVTAPPATYEPPPRVSEPCSPAARSVARLEMMLTTAPWRAPPYSAGNAPVKTSSESIVRGSITSLKFEVVAKGNETPSTS